MATAKKKAPAKKAPAKKAPAKKAPAKKANAGGVGDRVAQILADLEALSTQKDRDNLQRFGITAKNAFGVSMANLQKLAKKIGRDHQLAEALWQTDCYEARMLTAFVDEIDRVTPAQMDRWCKDFDNWAIVDTLCFKLWDQSPHAFGRVKAWRKKTAEQEKRAAFALLACLALHGRGEDDGFYLESLSWIEEASTDDRNFVKKGVSWALRGIGRKQSPILRKEALALAQRLAASKDPAAKWLGKDALKDLGKKK
jgi:3-methyladenine DNA glycosylase AlkD